jgi:hypothetical protein
MAGYSQTPLLRKLGIKPNCKLYFFQPPDKYFDWLNPLPDNIDIRARITGVVDFVHIFTKDENTFQNEFLKARNALQKDGMLWVSWPKKSAGLKTDLDENVIREFGLKNGMVDVKVCAVDEIWSGLKFVFRLKDRN